MSANTAHVSKKTQVAHPYFFYLRKNSMAWADSPMKATCPSASSSILYSIKRLYNMFRLYIYLYTFTCSCTNAHMQQYLQFVATGLPTMMEEKDTHTHTHTHTYTHSDIHTHTHHTIYDNNWEGDGCCLCTKVQCNLRCLWYDCPWSYNIGRDYDPEIPCMRSEWNNRNTNTNNNSLMP